MQVWEPEFGSPDLLWEAGHGGMCLSFQCWGHRKVPGLAGQPVQLNCPTLGSGRDLVSKRKVRNDYGRQLTFDLSVHIQCTRIVPATWTPHICTWIHIHIHEHCWTHIQGYILADMNTNSHTNTCRHFLINVFHWPILVLHNNGLHYDIYIMDLDHTHPIIAFFSPFSLLISSSPQLVPFCFHILPWYFCLYNFDYSNYLI